MDIYTYIYIYIYIYGPFGLDSSRGGICEPCAASSTTPASNPFQVLGIERQLSGPWDQMTVFRSRSLGTNCKSQAVRARGSASHAPPQAPPLFRVQGPGSRVQGSGFMVHGSGFRVQGAGCRVSGSRCRVQGVGCRMYDRWFGGQGLRLGGFACMPEPDVRTTRTMKSCCGGLRGQGLRF